jgi:BirA family biotin operon repressor/biotin-[acetyl-CoA-carboxylase] ligase
MAEPLPTEMASALDGSAERRGRFGATIHYFAEIGSTNDAAGTLADAGAPEGTLVVASAQTAGRGRFGRTWFSPPGAGLYVSVIVRDRRAAPLLTLAGGVAVAEGIRRATGLAVEIKWPNDIVVSAGLGRRRKLAGILAEASSGADGLQHIVLGFGINIRPAAYPGEIADRATSLESELGREVEPGAVLAECLAELARQVERLSEGDAAAVLESWRRLAPTARGAVVEWDGPQGTITGRTAGIDASGALLVHHEGGTERIVSGSVRWR